MKSSRIIQITPLTSLKCMCHIEGVSRQCKRIKSPVWRKDTLQNKMPQSHRARSAFWKHLIPRNYAVIFKYWQEFSQHMNIE